MNPIVSIKEKNRENLYSFYLNLAEKSGFKEGTVSSARYISNSSMEWPSYILGGGKMSKSSLTGIFAGMKDDTLPAIWLRSMEDDPEFTDFASEFGINLINLWQGMYLKKKTSYRLLPSIHGLSFEEVKTQKDLRDWLEVVNMEITPGSELRIKTFLNVLHDPAYRFFSVKRGKKTVSTILMHKRITETGIYMLSTLASERGKGIGKWITATAIDLYIAEGCKEFVLHSTPSAFQLYQDLGFEECCEYGVFMMSDKK